MPHLLQRTLGPALTRLAALGLALPLLAGPALAQVGMAQLQAGELPVTVVYPTDAPATRQSFGPFELQAALNAAPARGNGRLVVLSHGTGGDAFSLNTLASTLARAGFVVAQPEHRGDNWRDQSAAGPESWKRRPSEISEAINAIAQDTRFAGLLQLDRVGVFGMSAGGVTGLALAGGDWSLATMLQHCAAHVRDDAGFCLYGARSAEEAATRAQAYSRPLPPGAEAPLAGMRVHDARVAAVALEVPVGAIFTPGSLAAIRIPVGLVEAQADRILNPQYHSGYVLAQCGACQRLDSMAGAGHFDTLSPWPDSIAQSMARMPGGQRNPVVDDARRQQGYDRIAAFFREKLRP
ncbi:alpha/beta hydrolase family protein [Variovorax terrae]|uniref:Dienelactone hydrolase n=1 Tax=Variovorax terrae TaxID=2923278 RepID=A0A9X2ALL9_9BURK|nr:dienelactone hydrolase [Variovorax terrae]MCJ0762454.1 dienelactone hydrolase [Variovorax terrae]